MRQQRDGNKGDAPAASLCSVARIWKRIGQWTQNQSFSPHVWNDAYLAAFAENGGMELVTFDRALAQYTGVNCTFLPQMIAPVCSGG